VRCDSGQNYTTWPRSIPIIGSRRAEDRHTAEGVEAESESRKEQPPPPQTPAESDEKKSEQADDGTAWQGLTTRVSSIGDKISELLVPEWAKLLPGFLGKVKDELSTAPGSLAEQIWYEANDPETNPEIIWDAFVRISDDLCEDEKTFLRHRRRYTRRALARYLGLKESEVHPDDVPTIAMCGSGGGLRALVAASASYLSANEAGLFDCVTYTAGVSGSCWLQALYYSSISGQSHEKIIKHLKNRLGVHIAFPPAALSMLSSAPTNKYLLSGLVEKLKGVPDADYGIVDLYGLLLAARLLVPKGELGVDDLDLKVSNQRRFTDSGAQPMPIYTAVRHEIPIEEQQEQGVEEAKEKAKIESWFQWFE
jgi:cytosolic phospholipase A2